MARRTLHDRYFRQAKAEGYAARSAYKLLGIQDAKHLIRPGDRVLDLGCAPGSWVQVAAEIVGDRGLVVGVDLNPMARAFGPNVRAVTADVYKLTARELVELGDGLFDVILSDMAPSTGGGAGGSADHHASVRLCRRVLELAEELARPGANLAMKVFEGAEYADLLAETRRRFDRARGFKPEASRAVSREIYIVAHGHRPVRPAGSDAR